jgi:hypothetical protein
VICEADFDEVVRMLKLGSIDDVSATTSRSEITVRVEKPEVGLLCVSDGSAASSPSLEKKQYIRVATTSRLQTNKVTVAYQ